MKSRLFCLPSMCSFTSLWIAFRSRYLYRLARLSRILRFTYFMLSPLNQLARGYVIASRDPQGRDPAEFSELAPGKQLWLRFSAGRARTRVEEIAE